MAADTARLDQVALQPPQRRLLVLRRTTLGVEVNSLERVLEREVREFASGVLGMPEGAALDRAAEADLSVGLGGNEHMFSRPASAYFVSRVTEQLHLEKNFAAPRKRVFEACVEAEKLAEWWGPAGFTSPEIQLDGRVGGRYRITMQPPDGEAFHLSGAFTEVEAPRRLVYTFLWEEPDADDQETVVALTFEQAGKGTHLVLDHGPFKTEARYELHRAGWTETLDRLERVLRNPA